MSTKKTNFERVSEMNVAFGNARGNPNTIDVAKLRSQCRNQLDEFCELQIALGADPAAVQALRHAGKAITYQSDTIHLDGVRDALCDGHVFAYGAHHIMGLDADADMNAVVDGVMTRFIKSEEDKRATIALHAAKGVTQVFFEGEYPKMVMKSASYRDTVFPAPPAESNSNTTCTISGDLMRKQSIENARWMRVPLWARRTHALFRALLSLVFLTAIAIALFSGTKEMLVWILDNFGPQGAGAAFVESYAWPLKVVFGISGLMLFAAYTELAGKPSDKLAQWLENKYNKGNS